MTTQSAPRAVPAPVLVLGAIASVQTGAAVAQRLFHEIGPGGTVFLRLALSALMLGVVLIPRQGPRRPPRHATRRDLQAAVAFGLVLAAMNAVFYLSIDRIPLGVAVTVEFLGPLGVAIAGSRRWLDLLWVALAALGVVLLTGGGGAHLDRWGIGFAAIAGACWAAYILLSQRVGRAYPGSRGLAIALIVGALAVAPYGIVDGGADLLHPSVIGKGAVVAVLSSVIAYTLELSALRRLRAAVFGVLMSLEPAMAALSGLLFLGQSLRGVEWVAVGCVMTASIGATTAGYVGIPEGADVPLADEVRV